MENDKHQRQSKEGSKRNEKNAAMMSEMLMLDDTSHTNISEISFPSHVSGLDSFSEFEKTLQSSISEDESPVQNVVARNFDFEEKSKSADLSAFNGKAIVCSHLWFDLFVLCHHRHRQMIIVVIIW